MGSCIDLRDQQNNDKVYEAFSALVSGGKRGYKTIIERKVEPKKCPQCAIILKGEEKFCSECGFKIAGSMPSGSSPGAPIAAK